jgi:hypothetical protein
MLLMRLIDADAYAFPGDLEYEQTIDPESLRPKWISVEDRLPEYDQAVLCYKSDRGVRFGKVLAATYADGVQAFMDCERKYAFGATHWMPLPELPDMRGDA